MSIAKQYEQTNGGGVKRGTILIKTDAAIAVTTAPTSAGSVVSDNLALPKNIRSRVTALDANTAETAALIGVQGRCISDGAGLLTVYLWAALAVSIPINGFIKLEYEISESNTSD